eukprot:2803529-Prymnesium_polylepis.1
MPMNTAREARSRAAARTAATPQVRRSWETKKPRTYSHLDLHLCPSCSPPTARATSFPRSWRRLRRSRPCQVGGLRGARAPRVLPAARRWRRRARARHAARSRGGSGST